jgi:hypothetical protein
MVMRNTSEGNGTPHWWDDLPPKVRERFTRPLTAEGEEAGRADTAEADDPPQPLSRGELVGNLSWLAAAFAIVTAVILLYLLVAVTYVTG